MKAILRSGVLALVIMALTVSAHAGPFEEGVAAYQSGDYATALRRWGPLAVQGDAMAQSNLGVMYEFGLGVPQDFVQAHLWFNVAATQGDAVAQQNRDFVASEMTPDQITEAQRMAREWMEKHQQ